MESKRRAHFSLKLCGLLMCANSLWARQIAHQNAPNETNTPFFEQGSKTKAGGKMVAKKHSGKTSAMQDDASGGIESMGPYNFRLEAETDEAVNEGQSPNADMNASGWAAAKSKRKNALTDRALTFSLIIPCSRALVSVKMPEWPCGVSFISAQYLPANLAPTTAFQAGGGNSPQSHTKITIILKITKAGEYNLPPITLVIRGYELLASFPPLRIEQNIETAIPSIILVSSNTGGDGRIPAIVSAGQKVRLSLAAKFIKKIESISYEVPNNTIFQASYYDESAAPGSNPNGAPLPAGHVADNDNAIPTDFLWQPLEAGKTALPVISCDIIALNGKRYTVTTQKTVINVTDKYANDKPSNLEQDKMMQIFPMAFAKENENGGNNTGEPAMLNRIITYKECQILAQLRGNERRAIFPWKIRKERIDYEKKLGIVSVPNEMCLLPMIVCIVLCGVCTVSFAMLMKKRARQNASIAPKKLLFFSCAVLSFLFVSLAILCAAMILSPRGVFAGDTIRSIPDEASSAAPFQTGLPVKVADKASRYLYVESGNAAGWVLDADVIAIR